MPWPLGLRTIAAALLVASSTAGASGLQVAPVGLDFTPTTPAQGLWLTNVGKDMLNAQVRVFRWSESGGKDVLTPTQALVASPPILSLTPDTRQLVRVIRTGAPTASADEEAYRILIDELPQPQQQGTGVRYVLRYSVPVFIGTASAQGPAAVAASLHWSLLREGAGTILEIHNAGARHAQISDLTLLPHGGKAITLSPGLLGYVLPGSTMRWPLTVPAAQLDNGTHLKVTINGKPVEQAFADGDLPR